MSTSHSILSSKPIPDPRSSILEKIEEGLFPSDQDGHILVPMRGGGNATITSTKCPAPRGVIDETPYPLVGWFGVSAAMGKWQANGRYRKDGESQFDLVFRNHTIIRIDQYLILALDGSLTITGDATGYNPERVCRLTGEAMINLHKSGELIENLCNRGYRVTEKV